jgi:hypothetical protein
MVAFVGVVLYLKQQNYKQAWQSIKDKNNKHPTLAALKLLTEGCWKRQWMPEYPANFTKKLL